MFKNIFSCAISRNLVNNLFAREYACYRKVLPQFSTNYKARKSYQLIASVTFSKKSFNYPIIFCSSLAAAALGYQEKSIDGKEENEKLQYAINKALSFVQRKKFDKAEKQFGEALTLAKELNNIDSILVIYLSLAEIAMKQKVYKKGEQILQEAKDVILKNGLNFDDVKVVNIIVNLGMTYEYLKDPEKAKENYEFAYEVLEKQITNPKDDDLDLVILWSSVLSLYGDFLLKQSKDAEGNERDELIKTGFSHLEKSINVWVEKNGRERDEVVLLLSELAFKYFTLGDKDAAIKYLREAIDVGEKLTKSQILPIAYNNLGNIFLSSGMYPEAKAACEGSLRVAKDTSNKAAEKEANNCLREVTKLMRNAK